MDYLDQLERNGAALLAAATTSLDAPVPSCPGWDARRLVGHVGRLLTSTAAHVVRGSVAAPDRPAPVPNGDAELVAYYERALAAIVAALREVDPDLPAWNFTLEPRRARFWPRRLAAETLVHYYDAAQATGLAWDVDPAAAADAVDELLTILLPVARASGVAPVTADGTSHVHLTDTDADSWAGNGRGGEWLVRLDGPAVEVTAGHAKGDGVLRGPAGEVLLALWGRRSLDAPSLQVFGDLRLVEALRTGR